MMKPKHFPLLLLLGTSGFCRSEAAPAKAEGVPPANPASSPANSSLVPKPSLPPYAPWPSVPLKGGIYRVGKFGVVIGLREARTDLPTDDPVVVGQLPPGLSGVLGYLNEYRSEPLKLTPVGPYKLRSGDQFIVLRALGFTTPQPGNIRYLMWNNGPFRSLQFSGDGQNLLWGYGYTDRTDGMTMMKWGLSQGTLTAINMGIKNTSRYAYSFDSSLLANVGYDNSDTEMYGDVTQLWRNEGDGWLDVADASEPFSPEVSQAAGINPPPRYADYTPAIEKDPVLKNYPFWRATNRASRRGLSWGSPAEREIK